MTRIMTTTQRRSLSEQALSTPGRDCLLCPRLAEFRRENQKAFPDWHNAPVPSFGPLDACLLIVGLAPGLKGANRTSRPFTGDYAGDLLYPTISKFGLSAGEYGAAAEDGLTLKDARITNAVRCVPPRNKPTGPEIKTCLPFLKAEISSMTELRVVLALGAVAHGAVLTAMGLKKSAFPFRHGEKYTLCGGKVLISSYHCSRYNTNTGRLTTEMFEAVFKDVRTVLDT